MKKTAILLLTIFCAAISASAQSPSSVVDKVLGALKGGKTVSASYTVSSSQGSSKGTLVMSGKKFRVLASDIKCWYNGTTMWSYSPATDEVNITTPTAADLQMTNPYSAAQNFKSGYIISKGGRVMALTPSDSRPRRRAMLSTCLSLSLLPHG